MWLRDVSIDKKYLPSSFGGGGATSQLDWPIAPQNEASSDQGIVDQNEVSSDQGIVEQNETSSN
jgi:hypothetical protein